MSGTALALPCARNLMSFIEHESGPDTGFSQLGPAALQALGADRISQIMKDGGSPRLAMTLPSKILATLESQTVTIPGASAFSRMIAGTGQYAT